MRILPRIIPLVVASCLAATAWSAPDFAPKVTRPTHESWSDGPTLLLKHRILNAKPQTQAQRYREARLRLKAIEWGQRSTITTVEDVRNFLAGAEGKQGAIAELKARLGANPKPVAVVSPKLIKAATTSRERVSNLLRTSGVDAAGQSMLAEMMVWRGLAYNSSTLAHGSFGPKDAGNEELQLKAKLGLERAIARSFSLGERLQRAANDPRASLSWNDVKELQAEAVREFPEKEPGKVREVNFTWPVNSFGVHWENLHGEKGQVAKFEQRLAKSAGRGGQTPLVRNPIGVMARTLYWLHNVHPFRDGNGRTEVLLAWSMARGAGYPLPLEFDSLSGEFKLAATKWGGAPSDLRSFLAKGALGTERFVRKLLPVLDGGKLVSTHSDHGAVGSVVAPRSGRGDRSLVVMFPVTFAKTLDPELESEAGKNRVVMTGDRFDPKGVKIQIAIDGKHNAWQTIEPAAVNHWTERYPWWKTVEPIYKVKLPANASYVNFRVVDGSGRAVSNIDFYMNLRDYRNLGSRLPGGAR